MINAKSEKQSRKPKAARYELEIEGDKAFLSPLTFHVAEAALGLTFRPFPKKISAGEIIINSLILEGSSPRFKTDTRGSWYVKAALQAYSAIELLEYEVKDDVLTLRDHKNTPFSCVLKKEIDRDVLEQAIGLIQPNSGNAMPLTAGRLILNDLWISGDEEIKTNDELLIPACLAAYYRIEQKEGSLKKL